MMNIVEICVFFSCHNVNDGRVLGGTDTHLALLDLRPLGLDGAKVEKVLETVSIAVNKNTCPGDKSALKPSGIRLGRRTVLIECSSVVLVDIVSGTPALTTRGFLEKDIQEVGTYLDRAIQLAVAINRDGTTNRKSSSSSLTLKEFKETMKQNEHVKHLDDLKHAIETFAEKYPMPGYDHI
jgi:glycine hydroxymethyltransferase